MPGILFGRECTAMRSLQSKAEQAVERDVKGRFRSGSTGNPKGRPTGAAARILLDLRDWAESGLAATRRGDCSNLS